jgi:uncharacterized membrane protein
MSQPSAPSPSPAPPPARNGCLTALLILVGLILLVPGVCGIILVSYDMRELAKDQTAMLIAVGLLALGACGVVVIWLAVRPRR